MVLNLTFLRRRGWVFLLLLATVLLYWQLPFILRQFYPIPHREIIDKYAARYEIDPLLVAAVINAESKFSSDAVSRQGATGLMQIMPSTAEWIAQQMKVEYRYGKLFEPEYNLMLGTWYIAQLRKEFNNNLVLILAAYNGGRGNVQEWRKNNAWEGNIETISEIPFPETRRYVTKVLRRYRIYEYVYRGI